MRIAVVFDMEGTSHITDLREPFPPYRPPLLPPPLPPPPPPSPPSWSTSTAKRAKPSPAMRFRDGALEGGRGFVSTWKPNTSGRL